MANRTVVVIRLFIIRQHVRKRCCDEPNFARGRATVSKRGNRVLMLVVWKLGRELPFFFRLRRLVGIVGFAKAKARIFLWRCPYVTHGANCRACAGKCLSRKKLLSVAVNARVVVGKIRHVGKISPRIPIGRNFVTSIATQTLVLFRRMKKSGVLRDCCPRRLCLRRARRRPAALTSLCRRQTDYASANYDDENSSVSHENAI